MGGGKRRPYSPGRNPEQKPGEFFERLSFVDSSVTPRQDPARPAIHGCCSMRFVTAAMNSDSSKGFAIVPPLPSMRAIFKFSSAGLW
jgi:hypothetical protein